MNYKTVITKAYKKMQKYTCQKNQINYFIFNKNDFYFITKKNIFI